MNNGHNDTAIVVLDTKLNRRLEVEQVKTTDQWVVKFFQEDEEVLRFECSKGGAFSAVDRYMKNGAGFPKPKKP